MIALDMKLKGEAAVQKSLRAFATKAGVPIKWVCAYQLQLWAQDLVSNRTVPIPPSSVAGRKQIAKELSSIMYGVPPGTKTSMIPEGMLFKSPTGATWIATADNNAMQQPDKAALVHAKARGRKGRVSTSGRHTGKVNGMLRLDKLHLRQSAFRKYRRQVHKDVGRMKAGWIDAITQLSGFVGRVARVPSWLKKAPRTPGSGANINTIRAGSGYVEATNAVPYAEAKYAGFIEPTRKKRMKDITGSMSKRMKSIVAEFNAGRAAA